MTADRKIRGITAWLLAGAVLALTAAFLVSPRQTFSENENRWLAEFPAFDRESLFSGQYMTDIGTYLSDHFPFRDFFMGLKTQTELAEGCREIEGVYIADDGYLIERYEKPVNTEKIGGEGKRPESAPDAGSDGFVHPLGSASGSRAGI